MPKQSPKPSAPVVFDNEMADFDADMERDEALDRPGRTSPFVSDDRDPNWSGNGSPRRRGDANDRRRHRLYHRYWCLADRQHHCRPVAQPHQP